MKQLSCQIEVFNILLDSHGYVGYFVRIPMPKKPNCMVIGNTSKSAATAIMLIHPIVVGIGKWQYDRLLQGLDKRYGDIEHRLVFLTPDLLGSSMASKPTADKKGDGMQDIP